MGCVHATRAGLPRGEWGVCTLLGQVSRVGGEWGVCTLLGQVSRGVSGECACY